MSKDLLDRITDDIIKQPIEGILYDLDLMPEQCKSDASNIKRLVIRKLYKKAMKKEKVETIS